ncbi:hypothetical protein tinsulaeT_06270 [Thalassotalea insulae]|uniref:DUF1456 family protein n=1 Tax=Thalassotalea insulae TaxID=2056778 RepID=A0ABQ6GPJ4_9GAMM|nr:hypothetical protein tinsulaeT_06270 [Thalassotalea insulae]
MTNNDVLRRLRYTFNLNDNKVVNIFKLAACNVTTEQVKHWLAKDDDPTIVPLTDVELASFLNGFIIEKRGKKDGEQPVNEKELTKNLILLKLKIALKLQNDDIISLLATAGFNVGKAELTAFFRKPDHKNYRHCKWQFLRNFLQGLQDKYRVASPVVKSQNNGKNKPHYADKKSVSTGQSKKTHYVNPNAKPAEKSSTRKVLKLKPEQIYKNS